MFLVERGSWCSWLKLTYAANWRVIEAPQLTARKIHCQPTLQGQCHAFSEPRKLIFVIFHSSTSLMTLVNTARVFPAQLTCGEGQSGSSCKPPVLCPWQSLRWECKPARFGFAHQQSLCCLGCLPQHTWKQTDPSLKARFCW